MVSIKKNKEFLLSYFQALNGVEKTPELCDQWMTDQKLKEHVIFLDAIFPNYKGIADEMTAEGNRVVVRARAKGRHEGVFNGIPPTYKDVEFPFVVCYTIENKKITDHWLIADQMVLMQQLGVIESPESQVEADPLTTSD